jgi:site-specific DNA-methyltransferase (adenine-specific)
MKVEINNCTLYLGDCMDILPTLLKVDAVITDPPYNHVHMDGGGFASKRKFYAEGEIDFISNFVLSEYENFIFNASNQFVAFCSRDLIPDWIQFAKQKFGNFDLHVWHKTNAIPFTNNTWKNDIEYIVLGWSVKKHQKVNQHLKNKTYISSICTDDFHPTAKPIQLMAKYVQVLTQQNEVVLDPFMGSGTTGVAAIQMGRKFIGIEREPKYFDIACKRIEQASKQVDMFIEQPMAIQEVMF